MKTIHLTDEDAFTLLAIAEKIKIAGRDGERARKTAERNKFIDANPGVPQRELARQMKLAGLYAPSTFVGDITGTIMRRREAKA
jgi:hypothetical protein